MSWMPSNEWYEDLFDVCKTRAQVVERATGMVKDRDKRIEDFEEKFANPYKAAGLGYLDDVIEPNQTRDRLCRALDMLLDKEEIRPARKHGNIPL